MAFDWPYASPGEAAIPGTIKEHYEDFLVEEIPAYAPSGEGDHVYFLIEKRGLSTSRAVRDLSRALGARPGAIGVAGMKDARGITRQMLSLEHVDPEAVRALDIPRIAVLEVSRHRNKLRRGHLRGNRFRLKIRNTDITALAEVQRRMDWLVVHGVPNYFGPQRFGHRGDTGQIGGALVRDDFAEAASLISGRPGPDDRGALEQARTLFDAGQYQESMDLWPRGFDECRDLCRLMLRHRGDSRRAVMALGRRTLGFYVSAYQSTLFNRVVAERIDRLDRVENGDLAMKHVSGGIFLVESGEAENPRAIEFEISPTGPIFGHKMKRPSGTVAVLENKGLEQEGISLDKLPRSGPLKCVGTRRALRFKVAQPECSVGEDENGAFLEIGFALEKGCYATSLLREIFKEGLKSESGW
jgi:tRNA pseudouridine13 synthase